MKKILIVCQHFWPEEFRINDISFELAKRGFKVDVLCGIPNYPVGKFFNGYSFFYNRKQQINGVNIFRAIETPRGNTPISIIINYLSFSLMSFFIIPKLCKKKYDMILGYQLTPIIMMLPVIVLRFLLRIPTFMYIIDFWPDSLFSVQPFKNRILKNFTQSKFYKFILTKISYFFYQNTDGIIAVFEGIKSKLIKNLNYPKEKIIWVPQFCESLYEKDIQDLKLKKRFSSYFTILFAGNIGPAQSFDTILGASLLCKDAGLVNVRFVILGRGISFEYVVKETIRLKVEEFFIFEGIFPPECMPRYFHAVDALLVSLVKNEYLNYVIPFKIQTYLAAGKPILASMDGEGACLVRQSSSGFSSPAEDKESLFQNIKKMMFLSKEELNKMGQNARNYHSKYFNRQMHMDRLIKFIVENS